MYNQGISQEVKDLLDSKGNCKSDKFHNQPSSKLQRVLSRVVINSSKKLGILKKIERKKEVVKGMSDRKTKAVKEGYGATDTVKCFNRFAILANIEETFGETPHEISSNRKKGKSNKSSGKTTACTIPLRRSSKNNNMSRDALEEASVENIVNEQIACQSLTTADGKNQQKLDVKRNNSIKQAVTEGSKCLGHVIDSNIKDKCIDLKACLRQQTTPRDSAYQ